VNKCPRCGEANMREPLEINALSRTTRGIQDNPVYVCSDCGTDEGLEDYYGFATPQSDWPITARTYGAEINEMNRRYLEWSVAQ
jgi:hypothetical protein